MPPKSGERLFATAKAGCCIIWGAAMPLGVLAELNSAFMQVSGP